MSTYWLAGTRRRAAGFRTSGVYARCHHENQLLCSVQVTTLSQKLGESESERTRLKITLETSPFDRVFLAPGASAYFSLGFVQVCKISYLFRGADARAREARRVADEKDLALARVQRQARSRNVHGEKFECLAVDRGSCRPSWSVPLEMRTIVGSRAVRLTTPPAKYAPCKTNCARGSRSPKRYSHWMNCSRRQSASCVRWSSVGAGCAAPRLSCLAVLRLPRGPLVRRCTQLELGQRAREREQREREDLEAAGGSTGQKKPARSQGDGQSRQAPEELALRSSLVALAPARLPLWTNVLRGVFSVRR